MPNKPTNQLSLADLRAIIHSMKMAGFAFVDPEALTTIQERIKNLPSAEELNKMADDSKILDHLRADIGQILHMINTNGNDNYEYKCRYKAKTNLPPRYKVLNWEKDKKLVASTIRSMLRLSSKLDDINDEKDSEKVLKYAGKFHELLKYCQMISNDQMVQIQNANMNTLTNFQNIVSKIQSSLESIGSVQTDLGNLSMMIKDANIQASIAPLQEAVKNVQETVNGLSEMASQIAERMNVYIMTQQEKNMEIQKQIQNNQNPQMGV